MMDFDRNAANGGKMVRQFQDGHSTAECEINRKVGRYTPNGRIGEDLRDGTNVSKVAGLLAITIDRKWFSLKNGVDEGGHNRGIGVARIL
jgi:hypothetical protein